MRAWSAVAMVCVLAAGCGTRSTADTGSREVAPPTSTGGAPGSAGAPAPVTTPPPSTPSPAPGAASAPLGEPRSWRITTYFTAVQSFYDGRLKAVRGCPELHCEWGDTPLGSYPEDFLKVVKIEGSGRITAGPRRGRHLNWSHSVGWWLDTGTRDSTAAPLRAWSSAAADRDVLARGKRFRIVDCGRDGRGRPIPQEVCERFRAATWKVTDLFRPGYGGEHHADVYIGEETGPDFRKYYTTLREATIAAP